MIEIKNEDEQRRERGASERVKHGKAAGNAGGSNKGESDGGVLQVLRRRFQGPHLQRSTRRVVGATALKLFVMEHLLDGDKLATIEGKQGDSSPPSVTFT
ncbi:hypothetical protein PIB30_073494 [Stylosanthes scabra]|uniref:Histone H2A n=1 Tax=Stylosanthes scabra TaxID=79078 RepID=A0ABU6RPB1_9FABA|nr:hypothetical protein [Stylosanthes scabra]